MQLRSACSNAPIAAPGAVPLGLKGPFQPFHLSSVASPFLANRKNTYPHLNSIRTKTKLSGLFEKLENPVNHTECMYSTEYIPRIQAWIEQNPSESDIKNHQNLNTLAL
jgi:hypothetical protein